MIDLDQLGKAIDELRPLVQGDGGDLSLSRVDAAAGFVAIKLSLGESQCESCIVEPDMLREIVREVCMTSVAGVKYVDIEDPRVQEATL